MKQQDKLRNTLREHYDTKESSFDDNEWERASVYLSATRRKRKIRSALFILTAFVSTSFIVFFSVQKLEHEKNNFASLPPNQKLNSSWDKPSGSLNTAEPTKPEIAPSMDANNKTESSHTTHNKISDQKPNRTFQKKTTDLSSNKAPEVIETHNTKSEINLFNQTSTGIKEKPIDMPEEVKPIKDVNVAVINTTHQKEPQVEDLAASPENIELISATKENSSSDSVQTNKIAPTSHNFITQTPTVVTLNDKKNKTLETDDQQIHNREEKEFELKIDPIVSVLTARDSNSMEVLIEDTLIESSYLNQLAGEGIFYEIGAAWYYGWKDALNRDARGFSPMAGINYMNRLSKNCSVSFGVQYLQVRNLSNSSKTSKVSSYKYGEQSMVTVVTPSTVHYLVAPLRFHYYLNLKNSFGAGVNVGYLMNIDATVTTYEEKPGFIGNSKTIKQSGYTEGFSAFDSQLAIFYNRKIGGSLGLQGEVFLGLTDVKQDEFFGIHSKERNSGIKLSLMYYAFRKK